MKPHDSFERQLENLRNEAWVIAQYVYAEAAIDYATSKSKKLLNRLNHTPAFWITCQGALQSASYLSLGRVFDIKSPYNINALLNVMERSLNLFQREALANRKRAGSTSDPAWLAEYVANSYVPDMKDVQRLRNLVRKYRVIYDRAVMPVRHRYLAHRQTHNEEEVQKLFAKGTLEDLWRLSTFLIRLYESLRELFQNGRKPVLGTARYSIKSLYESNHKRSGPHEKVVRDTRSLLRFIENATPNSF